MNPLTDEQIEEVKQSVNDLEVTTEEDEASSLADADDLPRSFCIP